MDDFQLKGIVEDKFVKWEYNPSSATEKTSIAEENKAKAEQLRDDTKKTETDNQSNAMKEKHGKVSSFFVCFSFYRIFEIFDWNYFNSRLTDFE